MKRKIIRQGTNTLTISLPAHWTRKAQLGPGDAVEVSEDGDTLVVAPQATTTKARQSTVTITGLRRGMVFNLLSGAYARGDDAIIVHYKGADQLSTLLDATDQLIGFEVVEQGRTKCVIRDLSRGAEADVENLLRRIFLLIIGLAEDSLPMLREGAPTSVNALTHRDTQVNKFAYYCLRTINRGRGAAGRTSRYAVVLSLLEHLSDEYTRIFRDFRAPLKRTTLSAYAKVVPMTRELYELFYRYDAARLDALLNHRNTTRESIAVMMRRAPPADLMALMRIQKIAELIGDIGKTLFSIQCRSGGTS